MVVLFGVLSFIYFIRLSSFKSKINTLTALRAFQISLKLDTHQFSNDIPSAINQCDLTILRTCIPLLEALNIYRNRIIDYQFLVTNSLQLDSTDLLYQSLDDELLRIDSFMMRKFLYNFTMAKSNSITTIDGIFKEISDMNLPSAVNHRVLKQPRTTIMYERIRFEKERKNGILVIEYLRSEDHRHTEQNCKQGGSHIDFGAS